MLTDYIQAAMRHARYQILPDDNTFYGEIPDCPGVWANADTLEACRQELQEVLAARAVFRLRDGLDLPEIEGIDLTVKDSV